MPLIHRNVERHTRKWHVSHLSTNILQVKFLRHRVVTTNKLAPGVAKYLHTRNKTAQPGRQYATDVPKRSLRRLDHLETDEEPDDQFLGTLEDQSAKTSHWEVTLSVNGLPVLFKIDTGADVSAIPENILNSYIMFHWILALVAQASISYKCLVSYQLLWHMELQWHKT